MVGVMEREKKGGKYERKQIHKQARGFVNGSLHVRMTSI